MAAKRLNPAPEEPPIIHKPYETDFGRIQQTAPTVARRLGSSSKSALPVSLRVGVIVNARSHLNLNGVWHEKWPSRHAWPRTQDALIATLRGYAAEGVNFLVVDGGDGTVRDVITAAGKVFDRLPLFTVVPSGKTNALALDLGIPADWSVQVALEAARAGRFASRSPIEITRPGSIAPELRGFLFGAGRFVHATELAQRTHRAGAVNNVAVLLSLGWSIFQTLFGGPKNEWKLGETMHIRGEDGAFLEHSLYLLLASTLERMPLGLKPFGHTRRGLKVLAIDAPPKHILMTLGPLLAGSERRWLSDAGYHRSDTRKLAISLQGGFILDGEPYEGGELTLQIGEPVQFVVP